ncbi:MAG: phosphoribosylanthranilate isomerase [Pseudomonadota bacterium]
MQIKLCGFTEQESIQTAIAQKCDFLGFVFCAESPRFITPEKAAEISTQIPNSIKKVAVVVDADFNFLEEIHQKLDPDFLQFHGSENPNFLKEIRKKFPQIKIIKAFRITEEADLAQIKNYENDVDYFLFDGPKAGSGKKFNWEILKNYHGKKDWFLAGGLNIENIEEALKITGAKMIDISSGIEKIRGQKSPQLIEQFMKKIKTLCW